MISLTKVHVPRLAGHGRDQDILNLIKELQESDAPEDQELGKLAVNKALVIFRSLVQYDLEIHRAVNRQNIFRMEDVTSDKAQYRDFVRSVTQHTVDVPRRYVRQCFEITDKNRRVSSEARKPTVADWPEELRQGVQQDIDAIGAETFCSLYENYGYGVKDMVG